MATNNNLNIFATSCWFGMIRREWIIFSWNMKYDTVHNIFIANWIWAEKSSEAPIPSILCRWWQGWCRCRWGIDAFVMVFGWYCPMKILGLQYNFNATVTLVSVHTRSPHTNQHSTVQYSTVQYSTVTVPGPCPHQVTPYKPAQCTQGIHGDKLQKKLDTKSPSKCPMEMDASGCRL